MIHKTLKKQLKKINVCKSYMPVFSYSRLYIDANGRITNLEAYNVSESVGLFFKDPAGIPDSCVYIKTSDLLQLDNMLDLLVDRAGLTASCDGYTFKVLPATDSNMVEYFEEYSYFQESRKASTDLSDTYAKTTKRNLEIVAKTICPDESRFNLCGVAVIKGKLKSTDNHRITQLAVETNGIGDKDKDFIMSKYFIGLALMLAGKDFCFFFKGDKVTVTDYDDESRSITLVSTLIDGTFPNFSAFTDKISTNILDRIDLSRIDSELVGFLKPIANKTKEALSITSFGNDGIVFKLDDKKQEIFRSWEWRSPDLKEKPAISLGLRPSYLKDAIECGFTDWDKQSSTEPNVFRSDNINDLLIIMPVRMD